MAESGSPLTSTYVLPRDVLVVQGPDRKTWLDGLLTCAVTAVQPGVAAYGLLLTKVGKIVTDAFLVDSGTELYVGVAPGRGAVVRELLDRYLVMEDAELSEATTATSFYLSGATAEPEAAALASGSVTLAALVVQVSLVSGPVNGAAGADELAALLASHGFGRFGVDFGERDNPHEASLDRVAVSWTKGCYLGQEVVCMQDMRGKVKRRLVALAGAPALLPQAAQSAEVVLDDGSVAGQVTSAHATGDGTWLLASISSSALESQAALSVRGTPVSVVGSSVAKVS